MKRISLFQIRKLREYSCVCLLVSSDEGRKKFLSFFFVWVSRVWKNWRKRKIFCRWIQDKLDRCQIGRHKMAKGRKRKIRFLEKKILFGFSVICVYWRRTEKERDRDGGQKFWFFLLNRFPRWFLEQTENFKSRNEIEHCVCDHLSSVKTESSLRKLVIFWRSCCACVYWKGHTD